MSKTAMQELITRLEKKIQSVEPNSNYNSCYRDAMYEAAYTAQALLEKEKEQIKQAFDVNRNDGYWMHEKWNGEDYYSKTYTPQL